jgi:hypothetical protein
MSPPGRPKGEALAPEREGGPTRPRLLARFLLGSTLVAIAALAWLGYRRPDFVLWLGNSLFLCT